MCMYEYRYVCTCMYVYIHVWKKGGGGVCVRVSLYVNGIIVRNSRYEVIFVVLIVNCNKSLISVLF